MTEILTLDPSPEEWLTEERLDQLLSEIQEALPLLIRAGALRSVLRCWLTSELGGDEESSLAWARSQWGHRLDSLFLQRKDSLDQASCRLLRVKNQGIALEVYHRLLAGEASFEHLSYQFGAGSERFHGGLFKLQALTSFPGNMGQLLRRLKPGQLSKPLRMGDLFGIVQLEAFVPAVHGDASFNKILELELQYWLEGMTSHLEAQVNCSQE